MDKPIKAFMSWSGGKDSALAFYKARHQGIAVDALVTSVNSGTNRISMHGVRRELLQQQAAAMRLPLQTVELGEMPGMEAYEKAVHSCNRQLAAEGFTHGVFGDIFLQDLKRYRQGLMAGDGLACLFPIWGIDSMEAMRRFWAVGFKAVVVCVNSRLLPQSCCGRLLDETFINDLPAGIDPCGENGEYHSFVFDGPVFTHPVGYRLGEVVYREYAAPVLQTKNESDDCFTTPQPPAGFWYQDLIPA